MKKNTVRNVILICAMCAVAIMCIGLLVYDYIPTSLTVSKANEYETTQATTEVLSDATEAQKLLTEQTTSKNSTSGSTPVVKTNIVLKEYDVSKADIQRAKINGDLEQGRADPFAEVTATSSGSTSGATGENTTTVSDGTYYNSTRVK